MSKPTKLLPASSQIQRYHHTCDVGEKFTDTLKRDYWSFTAQQLRPGFRIELECEDGSWVGELYVRAATRTEAIVDEIFYKEFQNKAAIDSSAAAQYEVKWRGPHARWGVVSKADRSVVKEHFQSKDDAARWVNQHMKALAA